MVWLFVVIGAIAVFAIAAATVGTEAFRLGHRPPPTIFDLDEAVAYVADHLPDDTQGRLSYAEVRVLVLAELEHLRGQGILGLAGEDPLLAERPGGAGNGERPVVVADDDAVAVVLGHAEDEGLEVDDHDVFLVVSALHAHLADIGAVGPPA
ncbi:MAG: hypothetical protein ACRD2C_26005 [Acidimicrobiales bacterium]